MVFLLCFGVLRLGGHLICGTKCGKIFVLDATTLQPRFEQPIDQTDEEIVKISFSPCENFMAYYVIIISTSKY